MTLIMSKSEKFKYIKLKPDIIVKSVWCLFLYKTIKTIRSADAIVFHCFSSTGAIVSLLAKKKTKILWIGWGADYYSLFEQKGYQLYGPLTQKLKKRCISLKDPFVLKLKKRIYKYLDNKAINRISIFSPVIYEDYELYMSYFPNSRMEYFPWNYGISVEKNDYEVMGIQGKNILIGNSASYTNNHLEIFEILRNIKLEGRQLIVPLSYGDETYRDEIVKIGYELFGDAFHPLIDFMPYEEYQRVLQTCSVAIMNHYRQQASGNISYMISLGAKVFLSDRNPYYRFCLRLKTDVFKIDDLINKQDLLFTQLDKKVIRQNRINLDNKLNQKVIDKQTSDIIRELLGQ